MSESKELQMANLNQTQSMAYQGTNQGPSFSNPQVLDQPLVGNMPRGVGPQEPLANYSAAPQGQMAAPAQRAVYQANGQATAPAYGQAQDVRAAGSAQQGLPMQQSHPALQMQQAPLGQPVQGAFGAPASRNGFTGEPQRQGFNSDIRGQDRSGCVQVQGGGYQRNSNYQGQQPYPRNGGAQNNRFANNRQNYSQPRNGYEQRVNPNNQHNSQPQGINNMQQFNSNPYNAMPQTHSYDRRGFQSTVPFQGNMPQQAMPNQWNNGQQQYMQREPLPKALHAAQRPMSAPAANLASQAVQASMPNQAQPQMQSQQPMNPQAVQAMAPAHAAVPSHTVVVDLVASEREDSIVAAVAPATPAQAAPATPAQANTVASEQAAPAPAAAPAPTATAVVANNAPVAVEAQTPAQADAVVAVAKDEAEDSKTVAVQSAGCAAAKAACENKVGELSSVAGVESKSVAQDDAVAVAKEHEGENAQDESKLKGETKRKAKADAKAGVKADAKSGAKADGKGESKDDSYTMPNFFAKPSVPKVSVSADDERNEPKLIDTRVAFEMLDSHLPAVTVPFHAPEIMHNVPQKDHNYVFQPTMLNSVLMFLNSPGQDSLYLSGPTGCGKTSAILETAARLNWPIESVTLSQRTEVTDLIGRNVLRHGELHYEYGPLARAMLYGEILLLNEIDLLCPGELSALNDVIEGKNLTVVSNMGEKIYAHPGFRIIATANTKGNGDASSFYQGVRYQNQAFLDRWEFVECDYANNKQALKMITTIFPTINTDFVKLLLRLSNVIRYGSATQRGNHHDTVLTTYRTYDTLLSEQDGNRSVAYDLLTEEMPDIADALRRSLNAQKAAEVDKYEKDVGVIDTGYIDYLREKREQAVNDRNLKKLAAMAESDDPVDAAIRYNKDLVPSSYDEKPKVEKPNILQIIDSLNDLMVGRALSTTLHDRTFNFQSEVGAPLTDRALLRICRFYVNYPQMSVEECIDAGFGSRLNPDQFELVMRLTYDVFGYGSGINCLPHNTDMGEKYMELRSHFPKIVNAVKYAEDAMRDREELARFNQEKAAKARKWREEWIAQNNLLDLYHEKGTQPALADATTAAKDNLSESDASSNDATAEVVSPATNGQLDKEAVSTQDASVIDTAATAPSELFSVDALPEQSNDEAVTTAMDSSAESVDANSTTEAVADAKAEAQLEIVADANVTADAESHTESDAEAHATTEAKAKSTKAKRSRKSSAKAAAGDETASEAAPTKRKRSTSKAKAADDAAEANSKCAADLLEAISPEEEASA